MALAVALTVATWYTAAAYPGDVYCADRTMRQLQAAGVKWVAVDVEWYRSGAVRCGDVLAVHFSSTEHTLYARALDAGPLGDYQVRGMGQIGLDVPAHLWPVQGGDNTIENIQRLCCCNSKKGQKTIDYRV